MVLPLVSLPCFVVSYFMPFHAASSLCSGFFSLNPENTYSSFKVQLRCYHPSPWSLLCLSLLSTQWPYAGFLSTPLAFCTRSVHAPQHLLSSILALTYIIALTTLHCNLFIYISLFTTYWASWRQNCHFHVSSLWHIVSTKMLINWI